MTTTRSDIETAPTADRELVLTYLIDAPRELVWRMFTEPRHLSQFWGPHGSTNPVCEIDLRPGGIWRQVMRFPDGTEFAARYEYLEIAKPERIVYRDAPDETSSAGGHSQQTLTTTITFEDRDGKTAVTAHALFGTAAERELAEMMGFARVVNQGTERLAAYLLTLDDTGSPR
jgi:uncharacterized protein YndB with AHSA1/START domain